MQCDVEYSRICGCSESFKRFHVCEIVSTDVENLIYFEKTPNNLLIIKPRKCKFMLLGPVGLVLQILGQESHIKCLFKKKTFDVLEFLFFAPILYLPIANFSEIVSVSEISKHIHLLSELLKTKVVGRYLHNILTI